jgi:hypothetical protein
MQQFYAKYRELILFNKSIIIAAIVSIIADAIVVQYAAESITNDILVSIFSMITDSGVYLATFAGLFYIDNKSKYIDSSTGKKDSMRFRRDVKKVITTLGVSELVYMIRNSVIFTLYLITRDFTFFYFIKSISLVGRSF